MGSVAACLKGKKGDDYILSGKWVSLKELSATIGKITKRKTPKLTVSFFMARIGIPFIQLWATIRKEHPLYTSDTIDILEESHQNISCKKAHKELGYTARPIEDSVRDTFNWFKQNGFIK